MKNLIILLSLLFISSACFSQIELPSAGDSTQVVITMDNGTVYSGILVDRNEKEVMLLDEGQTYTLSLEDIKEVDSNPDLRSVLIEMKNGTTHKGTLLKESDREVVLQSKNGQLFLDQGQIATIETDYEKEFVRILMKDGTVYEGYRRTDKKEPNTVYTKSGKILYDPNQVNKIKIVEGSKVGYYEHPLSTRYFLTPTAIPMRKGDGYYSNQGILLNSYHYGLTDNVSIGGGFEIISTFFALTPTPFGHVKVSFSASDNFHYGGGVLFGGVFGQLFDEYQYYTAPYGLLTLGDKDKNLSFGGGTVFLSGETLGFLSLSGIIRVSPKLGLVSNNYLAINDFGSEFIAMQGVRIMGRSVSVDLGLGFTQSSLNYGYILPYVGFSIGI